VYLLLFSEPSIGTKASQKAARREEDGCTGDAGSDALGDGNDMGEDDESGEDVSGDDDGRGLEVLCGEGGGTDGGLHVLERIHRPFADESPKTSTSSFSNSCSLPTASHTLLFRSQNNVCSCGINRTYTPASSASENDPFCVNPNSDTIELRFVVELADDVRLLFFGDPGDPGVVGTFTPFTASSVLPNRPLSIRVTLPPILLAKQRKSST